MNTAPEIASDPSTLPHKEQMKLRRQFQDAGQRSLDWHRITDYKNAKAAPAKRSYIVPRPEPRLAPLLVASVARTAKDILERLNFNLAPAVQYGVGVEPDHVIPHTSFEAAQYRAKHYNDQSEEELDGYRYQVYRKPVGGKQWVAVTV